MKAAILICDHVADELKAEHGEYIDMYRNFFSGLELQPFYVIDNHFPDITDFELFICMGSAYSVYEDIDWINRLQQLVRDIYNQNKKFIGICFGHQLIAESLGGKVEPHSGGFLIGVHQFSVTKKLDWMQPPSDDYNVLMLCQDQVAVLPKDSTVLSTSPQCKVGMYTVGQNFLGIQGHPEFSKAYNRAVFESRADRISTETIELAVASMNQDLSTEVLRSWIQKFANNL